MTEQQNQQRRPRVRVGRLDTARDIRVELGRLYRAARAGQIVTGDASKLASILAIMLRAVELIDIESRLDELEGRADEIEGS